MAGIQLDLTDAVISQPTGKQYLGSVLHCCGAGGTLHMIAVLLTQLSNHMRMRRPSMLHIPALSLTPQHT